MGWSDQPLNDHTSIPYSTVDRHLEFVSSHATHTSPPSTILCILLACGSTSELMDGHHDMDVTELYCGVESTVIYSLVSRLINQ